MAVGRVNAIANLRIQVVDTEAFFAKIRTYTDLSEKAELAWSSLLRPRQYSKDKIDHERPGRPRRDTKPIAVVCPLFPFRPEKGGWLKPAKSA